MSQQCDPILGMIQSYYDGELLFDQKTEVEEHLSNCSECQTCLEALRELSESVQISNEVALQDVSFDGFFERIEAQIQQDAVPLKESFWGRFIKPVVEFFGAHKPILATSMVTAILVALVLIPIIKNQGTTVIEREKTVIVQQQPQVILESVAYDENSSVLISSTPNDETMVIWLLDSQQQPSDLIPRIKEHMKKKKRELRDNPI